MLGTWRGAGLATGHPLDGLLEALGWWGKRFETEALVDPLVFAAPGGALVAVEPGLMPARLALALPGLARSRAAAAAFRAALPLLRARRPGARLEARVFRGRESAAMVYLRQPIVDHLRAVDGARVLGLMDRPRTAPFFFLLTRAPAPEVD